jgi:uncharacterized protein (DUF433 family)
MNATARVREPIYPVAYAATLAGLDPKTARRWVRGYDFTHKGERRHSAPVVRVQVPGVPINDHLTFEELLTLRLVRGFREHGLGLPTIKKAAQVAAEHYGISNPFVTRAFRTDGRAVFLDLERKAKIPGEETLLVHALTGQQEFRDVVEPSLFRDVVFAGDVPGEWFPAGKNSAVVIRPDRAMGAPHLVGTGVRTDVVADAVQAEGGDDRAVKSAASWFGLLERQVRDAVAAEEKWRTPQAA